MGKKRPCIYCGGYGPYSDSHIVPESLGTFKGQPKQKQLVCRSCDHEIGKAEEQLARCSVEAFHRANLGITGKKKHARSFPFRRPYAGKGPIEISVPFPEGEYEVWVEPIGDGENAQPVPQLVLIGPGGEYDRIRLSEPMKVTTKYLRDALRKSPVKGENIRLETVGLSEEEVEHVFSVMDRMGVLLPDGPGATDRSFSGFRFYPNVRGEGQVIVDARHFRAIAKIAFQYFIEFSGQLCGYEDCFAPVKRFIRYGEGRVEDFVVQRRGNLVSDLNFGFRPSYYGHFIIGEVARGVVKACVQLFIGKDNDPPYYEVILSKCCTIVLDESAFGHFYAYYLPAERSQYTGEIQRLGATRKIRMPKRFGVDLGGQS